MVKSKNIRKSIITSCECVGCVHLSALQQWLGRRRFCFVWIFFVLFKVQFMVMVLTLHQSAHLWSLHEKTSNLLIYATWSKVRKGVKKQKFPFENYVSPRFVRKKRRSDGESILIFLCHVWLTGQSDNRHAVRRRLVIGEELYMVTDSVWWRIRLGWFASNRNPKCGSQLLPWLFYYVHLDSVWSYDWVTDGVVWQ